MARGGSEAPKIVWSKRVGSFKIEDQEAYLDYELRYRGKAIDILHTYAPPSKNGLGLTSHLCITVFSHARSHLFFVIPSSTYVSDIFLAQNPSWNSILHKQDLKSSI
ncbi:Acetyltransferase [Capsicum annuum]|uniref:Acetyltransferase n=1 Tax=Capsicum annuum TaxID=4072 RepID=A0A2G2YXF4_CAPAN|nr:Acetyltransferase [Capsicum annuum]